MNTILHWLYSATWLWLPFLVLFLAQGLRCSPQGKLALFKIGQYYIVSAMGLQILLPNAHLGLRSLLFDLASRVFLFVQAAEILWSSWTLPAALAVAGGGSRVLRQQKLMDDEQEHGQLLSPHQKALIGYALTALLYLGWLLLGVLFAFTLTPGM